MNDIMAYKDVRAYKAKGGGGTGSAPACQVVQAGSQRGDMGVVSLG
jgi:hypothetical protein